MEFFIPCWIALGHIFSPQPSISYVKKQSKTFTKRIAVCNNVGMEAQKQGVDPILAISVSFHETRFTYAKSAKGAKGPMGVIPYYHCPKKGKGNCDLVKAGVGALGKFLALNDFDYCQALAQYNRGNEEGKCEKGRSEYFYAQAVLSLYDEICMHLGSCETC